MTDYENAERLRTEYLKREPRKNFVNICRARPNWNGCAFCDVYAGPGLECWQQHARHNCCYCEEMKRR